MKYWPLIKDFLAVLVLFATGYIWWIFAHAVGF